MRLRTISSVEVLKPEAREIITRICVQAAIRTEKRKEQEALEQLQELEQHQ